MLKVKWLILIFEPLVILALLMMILPGPAVAAPLLGITLTPTDTILTNTPVTPTEVTPTEPPATPTPTATDVVEPPNPTPTPTAQFTATPEVNNPRVRVTPSLPETGETPPESPFQRLDWLGIFMAAFIAFAGTLAYHKITSSKRGS